MKYLIILLLTVTPCFATTFEQYNHAVHMVENSGKATVKDHKDTNGKIVKGPLQESYDYWYDATHNAKGKQIHPGTWNDCRKLGYASKVLRWYAERYEPKALADVNVDILARLHNSGPGWRNHKSLTDDYVRKVQKYLKD